MGGKSQGGGWRNHRGTLLRPVAGGPVTNAVLVHGTAVAIDGEAVLLLGPSGAGKSDLALRLIETGAQLVADDQAELRRSGSLILVSAPAAIFGLIEARGIGI